VPRSDYDRFTKQIDKDSRIPMGVALSEDSAEVLVTPGPFEMCGAAAMAAGAPGIVGPAGGTR
jgi:hypothetical protein